MKLTVRNDEATETYVIERSEHDGRGWWDRTPFGRQWCKSSRICGNGGFSADIEGSAEEMREIARAIRGRSEYGANRCYVDARWEPVRFGSPRNDNGRKGEASLEEANDLAWQIERLLDQKSVMTPQENITEFFMVYREGGRLPVVKHNTEEEAVAEAKHIATSTGDATYVLAAVKTIQPHAMPVASRFADHVVGHPYGDMSCKWGLWRVVVKNRLPAVVAVRIGSNDEPCCSADSPGGSSVEQWKEAKWFPLASDGSDLGKDDIPF